jgi:prophage DNA circulation protein
VRKKPVSEQAAARFAEDTALAARFSELLSAAQEADQALRTAQAERAPLPEQRTLALALDTALTAAMRAAYAAQRVEIGPHGYDDRIVRRKAKATPAVHAWTDEAERLLTLRETHRLTGIPRIARVNAA